MLVCAGALLRCVSDCHTCCRHTDSIIQETLRDVVKGARATTERIMIVIAHRVTTIMDCDQLLVLADGRLVESGSPEQLAKGSGMFARLVKAAEANERRQQDGV